MKFLAALVVATALLAVGCGGDSSPTEPTERDAARLLDREALVSQASCARTQGREFVCGAYAEDRPVTLHATVTEDGRSIVVTNCDDEDSIYSPCETVR
jgi:hypothetical protein